MHWTVPEFLFLFFFFKVENVCRGVSHPDPHYTTTGVCDGHSFWACSVHKVAWVLCLSRGLCVGQARIAVTFN